MTGPDLASYSPIRDAKVRFHRPDISSIIEDNIDEILMSISRKGASAPRGGGLAVGTCGPDPLVRSVRSAVAGIPRKRAVAA